MAIKATTLREDHVSKRETPLGRWFPVILYAVNLALWIAAGIGVKAWDLLWLVVLALPVLGLYLWTNLEASMTPDFTLLLVGGMVFAVAVLSFVGWRFGGPDTLAFSIVSGGFTAVMDFLSAFVMWNYEYPGQSPLWVFTYIFFWLDRHVRDLSVPRRRHPGPTRSRHAHPTPAMVAGAACHRCNRRSAGSFHRPCCRRGGLLDLVGEGHGLLRHSPAQLRGLVCTHVSDASRLDLDRPTA